MTIDEFRRQLVEHQCTHLFVDLDDTLLDGDSLPWFCRYLLRRHFHQPSFHLRVSAPLLLAATRLRPAASFKPSLARFFEGWDQEVVQKLGSEFTDSELEARIRPDLGRLLRDAQERQTHLVLATASLDLYCQPLAQRLGIDTLLSTELGYENGVCTGKLKTPNCKGMNKLSRVQDFCTNYRVDPRGCAFLSDHQSDIPCFELVGLPAVVSPSHQLRELAQGQGIPELEV
ncbi:MAG: HAD-IB family hydrolase [Deltaproteobacteria bacterium]|nr:HAD-IB family hydrolase [Deltaproteobacteria bacterium]